MSQNKKYPLTLNPNFHRFPEENVAIIWQAKAACTLVNKMIFHHEGLLDEALSFNPFIHEFRKHHMKQNVDKKTFNNDTKWIQFTVNPYRRAVSSYIHCSKHYEHCLGVEEYNMSFKEFLLLLEDDNTTQDIHHNSQVFQHYDSKEIEYIKMENIDSMLPYIEKKYNLNLSIPRS